MPGATRLEVGPRESRAGSRVPRYTSSGPTVPATCQGRAVHAPGAPPGGVPPPTYQCEAPCSALADDIAEEGLCPYTYGSAMLRAGDKQLRVALGCINLREPRAQCLASSQRLPSGVPREGAGHGGYAQATPGHTPPSQAPRAWFIVRPSPSGAKVRRPFERQGGLLSIATQEPNWSRSPSLLSFERLTAVEVCAGPGSADVER